MVWKKSTEKRELLDSKRILVCGDRNWADPDAIERELTKFDEPIFVIEGGAPGADRLAAEICRKYGIPYMVYRANWDRFGRAAGPIRNKQMLEQGRPHLVLAFHHDLSKSKGTRHMVKIARDAGIEVKIFTS